jgi:hypothetical protein
MDTGLGEKRVLNAETLRCGDKRREEKRSPSFAWIDRLKPVPPNHCETSGSNAVVAWADGGYFIMGDGES